MEQSRLDALLKAVNKLGSMAAVSRAVGVSPQAVSEMVRKPGKDIPADWCIPIERATGGAVSRHELRPDLYPEDDGDTARLAPSESANSVTLR